jgi:hypothetical protein
MGIKEMLIGFGGKSKSKETTRKTIRRWVGNIKMDLGDRKWGCMNWIHLSQDRD